jgi:hypothetical protein
VTTGDRTEIGAAAASEPDVQARRRIAAAVERARSADAERRVMVVFTGDWCGDSAAFLAALEHPLVAPLVALGFEVVTLDAGNRDRHLALAEGWGLSYARGLPAVAVLDADGELVAATREGELASARLLSPIDVATLVHRWLPEGVGTAGAAGA